MRVLTVLISIAILFAITTSTFAQDSSKNRDKSFTVKEQRHQVAPKQGELSSEFKQVFDNAIDQFEAQNYDESIQLLTRVINAYPNYIPAYKTRGLAFMEKGKITKSKIDKADNTYNKSIYEFQRATKNFSQIIKLNSSLPYPYFYRAVSYVELDYYAMPALDDLNKYIDDFKVGTIEAYYYRGLAYLQRGNIAKAESDLKKVIDMDQNHSKAYSNIMKAYDTRENYDDAIDYFGILIKRYPDNAHPWYYRGLAYLQQENYQKAIADFDKAITIYPSYTDARRMRNEAIRDGYR